MTEKSPPAIHLQGIGRVNGKYAHELTIGDRTIWNYGYIETVESVEIRGKSVYTTLRSQQDGKLYPRRFLQTRIVGISNKK